MTRPHADSSTWPHLDYESLSDRAARDGCRRWSPKRTALFLCAYEFSRLKPPHVIEESARCRPAISNIRNACIVHNTTCIICLTITRFVAAYAQFVACIVTVLFSACVYSSSLLTNVCTESPSCFKFSVSNISETEHISQTFLLLQPLTDLACHLTLNCIAKRSEFCYCRFQKTCVVNKSR